MKHNNFFIALALCAAMQSNISFCSEVLQQTQEPQNQSYWQQYTHMLKDMSSYVSEKATNVYDTVNKWSTRKKIIVASAIIGALSAAYNKDQIMQWVSDILLQETPLMREFKEKVQEKVEVAKLLHRSSPKAGRFQANLLDMQMQEMGDRLIAEGVSKDTINKIIEDTIKQQLEIVVPERRIRY